VWRQRQRTSCDQAAISPVALRARRRWFPALTGARSRRRSSLRWDQLEALEVRQVLAKVDIQFDYSMDTSGFFADASRKALLDLAAASFENRFTDNLAAIVPGGGNTWTAVIDSPSQLDTNDPSRRLSVNIDNQTIAANTIRIYVGAIPFGSSRLAEAGPGGYNANGTTAWLDLVQARGQVGALASPARDVGLWGGSMAFSSDANWYFGTDGNAVPAGRTDFVTVAIHELGHVLGFGTLAPFTSRVVSGTFNGPEATRINGGTQPAATSDGGHWATGVTSDNQQAILVPTIPAAKRLFVTSLDWAALQDIGWEQGNRMYRLFNPNANFHFFTTSKGEFDALVRIGLNDESTNQPGFAVAEDGAEGAVALFRMYNPNKGSHYYTTSEGERDFLLSRGWNAEGTVGNVFQTRVPGTTELFRLYNNDSGVHLFTTDVGTKNTILSLFPGIWEQHTTVGFAFTSLPRNAAGSPAPPPAAALATGTASLFSFDAQIDPIAALALTESLSTDVATAGLIVPEGEVFVATAGNESLLSSDSGQTRSLTRLIAQVDDAESASSLDAVFAGWTDTDPLAPELSAVR
jgi:hypothetical protein